jgi:translation elongation factor P/translation initiation factor 5A
MPETPVVVEAGRVVVGDYLVWDDALYEVLATLHHRDWLRGSTVDLELRNPHGGPSVRRHYRATDEVSVTRVP